MKKTLAILGAGIVVGAVAYAVWYKMNKSNKTVENDFENKKDNTDTTPSTPAVVTEDDVETIKSTVAQNMAARHEEAAQIMKDAVDIICKRSEVSVDETKELEQISDELDELLSEE